MRDIIVIGVPVGGGALLTQLICQFPADLEASVFVALHTTPENPMLLADVLNAPGRLRAAQAIHGEAIERRRIYVAAEGKHLLLKDGTVELSDNGAEYKYRPSIDGLFSSAANAFSHHVIGVLLLHTDEDGLLGLYAVRKAGGRTITQRTAQMPDAPRHPQTAELLADYHLELAEIGPRVLACFGENGNGAAAS